MKLLGLQVSSLCLAVFLVIDFAASGDAGVETIQIELSGFVSNDDARQIRRLIKPWANPEDVVFKPAYDKKKRKRHFTTVVEITPRRGKNKYSEHHTFDVYNIIRQLNDQRFRGSQIGPRPRVAKSEVTVTGSLFAHAGWSRSYLRNVPFWRRWRAETSVVNHAMVAGRWDQKIVFSNNDKFHQLRQEASRSKRDQTVEVKGKIVGFDGPYPVMSIRKFSVDYSVEPHSREKAKKQPNESYEYLEEALEESGEKPQDASKTSK